MRGGLERQDFRAFFLNDFIDNLFPCSYIIYKLTRGSVLFSLYLQGDIPTENSKCRIVKEIVYGIRKGKGGVADFR